MVHTPAPQPAESVETAVVTVLVTVTVTLPSPEVHTPPNAFVAVVRIAFTIGLVSVTTGATVSTVK